MADTVTTGQTAGSPFIWLSSSLAWKDATATAKTWLSAYDASFNVNVAGTLGFAESARSTVAKVAQEALALSDLRIGAISKAVSEACSAADLFGGVAQFSRSIVESAQLSESARNHAGAQKGEAFAVTEAHNDVAEFSRNLAESAVFAEGISRNYGKKLSDAWATSEAGGRSVEKTANEYIAASSGALSFNGTTGYASVPPGPFSRFTSDFTVMARVRSTDAAGQRCVVSTTGNASGWRFGMGGGAPYFLVGETGGANYREGTIGSVKVNDGLWHHLAIVFKMGVNVTAVVDGVETGTVAIAAANANNNGSLTFGRMGSGTAYYNGLADDVQIYSRALSAAEIAGIADGSSPSVSELVGQWGFDELSGTVLYDTSGNEFHGTLGTATRVSLVENRSDIGGKYSEVVALEDPLPSDRLAGMLIATDSERFGISGWERVGVGDDNPMTTIQTGNIPVKPSTKYFIDFVIWTSTGAFVGVTNVFFQFNDTGWPASSSYVDLLNAGHFESWTSSPLSNGLTRITASFTTKPTTQFVTQMRFDADSAGVSVFVGDFHLYEGLASAGFDRQLAEPLHIAETRASTAAYNRELAEDVAVGEARGSVAGFYRAIPEAVRLAGAKRTNLIGNSENIHLWGKTAAVTFTPNAGTWLGMNWTKVSVDGTTNSYISNSLSGILAGQTVTRSMFVKAGTTGTIVFEWYEGTSYKRTIFNVLAGTITGDIAVTAGMIDMGDGIYRCWATKTFALAGNSIAWYIGAYGNGVGDIYLAGGQIERGSLAAYIPTPTGAAVTVDDGEFSAGVVRAVTEALNATEAYDDVATFARAIAEALSVSEAVGNAAGKPIAEIFSTAESYDDVATFARQFAETVATNEGIGRAAALQVSEAVALLEDYQNEAQLRIARTLSMAESHDDVAAFSRSIAEMWGTAETHARTSSFNRQIGEALATAEADSRLTVFDRKFPEVIAARTGGRSAMLFDGVNGQVAVPHSQSLANVDTLSIEFRVRGSVSAQPWHRLIRKATGGAADSGWMVYQSNSTAKIGLRLDTTGAFNQNRLEIASVLDGALHHIAYTLNAGIVKAYKDGAPAGQGTYLHGTGFGTTDFLYLAKSNENKWWPGQMADVRIYSRELSAAEVASNAAGSYAEDGCVLNMPLNGDALDYSGLNNHGTISGGAAFVLDGPMTLAGIEQAIDYSKFEAEAFASSEAALRGFGQNNIEPILVDEVLDRQVAFDRQMLEFIRAMGGGFVWSGADFSWSGTSDSWNSHSSVVKGVTTPKGEAVAIAEGNARTAAFGRGFAEAWSMSGTRASGATVARAEALSLLDTSVRSIGFIRGFTEGVAVTEGSARNYAQLLAETLGATSAHDDMVAFDRKLGEVLAVSEQLGRTIGKSLAESVTAGESFSKVVGQALVDSFGLSDISARALGLALAEALKGVDENSNIAAFARSFAESWTVAESSARVATFDRQVAEVLTTLDGAQNASGKSLAELFALADAGARLPGLGIAESLAVAELYSRVASFARQLTEAVGANSLMAPVAVVVREYVESIGVGESVSTASAFDRRFASVVGTSGGATRGVGKNHEDALGVVDALATLSAFDLQLVEFIYAVGGGYSWSNARVTWSSTTDSWGASNSVTKGAGLAKSESWATAESSARVGAFTRSFAEAWATAEQNANAAVLTKKETLTTSDSAGRSIGFTRDFADEFSVTSVAARDYAQVLAETLEATDAYGRIVAFDRKFTEVFSSADALGAVVGKALVEAVTTGDSVAKIAAPMLADAFGLSDAGARAFAQVLAESLKWTDAYDDVAAFARAFSEAWSVVEARSHAAAFDRQPSEALAVAESRQSSTIKAFYESAAFAETLGRLATYNRAVAEGMTVADASARAAALSRAELFRLGDELRRNADAIVSDILVGKGDISPQKFQEMLDQAQATGYGPFELFAEGDHEYKNAVFKAVVASGSSSRLRIEKLAVNVDAPDLFDGGTVSVTSSGTATVTLNRQFNVLPEVNLVLKGGTVFVMPRVTNITTTQFVVELFDATGSPVAGTVSWAAHGY